MEKTKPNLNISDFQQRLIKLREVEGVKKTVNNRKKGETPHFSPEELREQREKEERRILTEAYLFPLSEQIQGIYLGGEGCFEKFDGACSLLWDKHEVESGFLEVTGSKRRIFLSVQTKRDGARIEAVFGNRPPVSFNPSEQKWIEKLKDCVVDAISKDKVFYTYRKNIPWHPDPDEPWNSW